MSCKPLHLLDSEPSAWQDRSLARGHHLHFPPVHDLADAQAVQVVREPHEGDAERARSDDAVGTTARHSAALRRSAARMGGTLFVSSGVAFTSKVPFVTLESFSYFIGGEEEDRDGQVSFSSHKHRLLL